MFSYGVNEKRDIKTKEVTGYSIHFLCENEKFIKMIQSIEKFCRDRVKEKESKLKKDGMKSLNIDNLNILKYKDDSNPILYAKIPINFESKKTEQVFRSKDSDFDRDKNDDILGESLN